MHFLSKVGYGRHKAHHVHGKIVNEPYLLAFFTGHILNKSGLGGKIAKLGIPSLFRDMANREGRMWAV